MVYLGIVGQYVAAILGVVGLTLMIQQQAPWSYVIMTACAIIFAVFTKIRLIGYERNEVTDAKRSRARKRKT